MNIEHCFVNNGHIPNHMSTTQNIKETQLTLTSLTHNHLEITLTRLGEEAPTHDKSHVNHTKYRSDATDIDVIII